MDVDSELQLVIMADKVTNVLLYTYCTSAMVLLKHRIQCIQEFFLYISITLQSYTKKYPEFVAVCINMSVQHE